MEVNVIQKLCIISEYDCDFILIDILQNSDKYELKAIFLTNTSEMPTKNIGQVKIVNNTHLEYFDLCDAIYFSHNCQKSAEVYRDIAYQKGKLINQVDDFCKFIGSFDKFYEINIPIFVLSGTRDDCGKNQLIAMLSKELKKRGENIAIVSNYENSDLLEYYKYPMDLISEARLFNEKKLVVNHFIHRVAEESKCSILLLSMPGGVCNPFFPSECESEILMYLISKACMVDYTMYILPVNLWLQEYIYKIGSKISGLISTGVDYWIMSSQMYDSTLMDNAINSRSIPIIDVLDETMVNVYNGSLIPCSSHIREKNIANDIIENIICKLHQETQLYKIL